MNRKLHNAISALAASGAVLVVGLVAAVPVSRHADSETALAAATGELEAARAIATAIETAAIGTIESGTSTRSTGTTRNRRQTLVMPYFSFVPRG